MVSAGNVAIVGNVPSIDLYTKNSDSLLSLSVHCNDTEEDDWVVTYRFVGAVGVFGIVVTYIVLESVSPPVLNDDT